MEQAEQIEPLYLAQLGSLTEIVIAPPEVDPVVDDVEAVIPVLEVVVVVVVDDPELPELDPEAGEHVEPTRIYPEIQAVH